MSRVLSRRRDLKALDEASRRGVFGSMLLESSRDHGGSITIDAIGTMKTLLPTAQVYAWRDKAEPFADGRVHAKVAVADATICFITSANLTDFAMERNMEAGVPIKGGRLPRLVDDHVRALVETKVVTLT
jgi:phosphatidylserine/phosphatidylglycerophosphate/cardiolipin synthase-like enzyme